jgi:hypothetical protein
MPPPPGMEIGAPPPPAPRKLPEGYAFKQRVLGNPFTLIGGAFTLVGWVMGLAMLAAPGWVLLIPGFLLIGGIMMLWRGLQTANRGLDAFQNGKAIQGRISDVRQDTGTKVNGRSPWIITYTFDHDGHAYEGETSTWETATANRMYGKPPVWVLVVEGNPARNTMYPPLK